MEMQMEEVVEEVVAAVEPVEDLLEQRLAAVETALAQLKTQTSLMAAAAGRKTIAASAASLMAKQGVTVEGGVESGALDAALSSLSIEQRIAVKSQLMRAGLVG